MATVCSRFEKSYALEHSLNDRYRVESEPSPPRANSGWSVAWSLVTRHPWNAISISLQRFFVWSDPPAGGNRIKRRCAPVRMVSGWKRDLVTLAAPRRVFEALARSLVSSESRRLRARWKNKARPFCSRKKRADSLTRMKIVCVCGTASCAPVESFLVRTRRGTRRERQIGRLLQVGETGRAT